MRSMKTPVAMVALFLCISLIPPAPASDTKLYKKEDTLATKLHKYLESKLVYFNEDQKMILAKKIWYKIHTRKLRNVIIRSSRGPWINDGEMLARIL